MACMDLTFNANCLHWRQFVWNDKSYFLEKIRKNISKCHLLKILPRVLSVKTTSCWQNISCDSKHGKMAQYDICKQGRLIATCSFLQQSDRGILCPHTQSVVIYYTEANRDLDQNMQAALYLYLYNLHTTSRPFSHILYDIHYIHYYFYAPPPKKWRGIMLYPLKFWVSVCLSVRPSVSTPTMCVPATPPIVLGQSFSNFTGAFRMVWRYDIVFFRILNLFFIAFFAFLT